MSTHVDLWIEELQLSGQKFKLLHGLLSHAQFKPLIGQRLWELSEVGTKERGGKKQKQKQEQKQERSRKQE